MHKEEVIANASTLLWRLSLALEAIAFLRIMIRRLWRLFPFFCIYLVTDLCRSLVLWVLGKAPDTDKYSRVWSSTEPWALLLNVFVTLEVYKCLYRAYPGIQRFARIVIGVGIVISVALTFGTISIDLNRVIWRKPDLQRLFLLERIVSSLIAILLAITMAIFPKAQSAVTVIQHGWLLTALFSFRALEVFFVNAGMHTDAVTLPFLAAQCCLYFLWAFWLTTPTTPQPPRSDKDIARTEQWNRELMDATDWLVRR